MTKQTLDVLGLTPNQNYVIKVFATRTDPATGNVDVSYYSPTLQISTPSLSGSGTNLTTTNYGTDIQLAGGSLFAGTFPSNIGQIDLTITNPNGTGVVVNQTGVGAYSGGVQEFFLNAKTGAATFAGTITTPTIQSGNYSASLAISEPKFSVAGTQISLTDGSISAPQFRIDTSGNAYFTGSINANATINGSLASTVASRATGAIQPGAYVSLDSNNTITKIDLTGGILLTSSAAASSAGSGNRIELNVNGLTGYSGTTPTFQFQTSTGSLILSGQLTALSGSYLGGWSISGSDIIKTSSLTYATLPYTVTTDLSAATGAISVSALQGTNPAGSVVLGDVSNTGQGSGLSFYYNNSTLSGYIYSSIPGALTFRAQNAGYSDGYMTIYAGTSLVQPFLYVSGAISVSSVKSNTIGSTNGLSGITSQTTSITAGTSSGTHASGDIVLVYV